jgi:hypothetical protein
LGGIILHSQVTSILLIYNQVATGRQVFSSRSHLQSITCIVTDPSHKHIISGSDDSNVQIWSLESLLSFATNRGNDSSQAPVRTLSRHRAGISSLTIGHSSFNSNIVISASRDNTCVVWNYHDGSILRTILLALTPLCLALDPADRALFVGLDDGSIQMIDFFALELDGSSVFSRSRSDLPFQAQEKDRWTAPSQDLGSTLAIAVLYEGTYLLSSHESGKVVRWNITGGSRAAYDVTILTLEHPVTNIQPLPPAGFSSTEPSRLKLGAVVKPRYDPSISENRAGGVVPPAYSITAQLSSFIPGVSLSATDTATSNQGFFTNACSHPSFPKILLQYDPGSAGASRIEYVQTMDLDGGDGRLTGQEDGNPESLRDAVAEAQAAAQLSKDRYDALLQESTELLKREQQRKQRKKEAQTRLAAEGKELPSKLNGGKPLKKGERLVRFAGRPRVTKKGEPEVYSDEISSTEDCGSDSPDDSISSGGWMSQEHD